MTRESKKEVTVSTEWLSEKKQKVKIKSEKVKTIKTLKRGQNLKQNKITDKVDNISLFRTAHSNHVLAGGGEKCKIDGGTKDSDRETLPPSTRRRGDQ